MSRPRVAVIGLDSLAPVMFERFMNEGRMPALQRLRQRGFYAEMVPTMPPTTPAGWTTVTTGAWPSSHGVEGFAVHRPGDPLDRKIHSLTSDTVRAEFLWQAAERAGRRSIVVKFPISWPSTGGDRLVQVDGAAGWGGMKCVWDLAASGCWDTQADDEDDADGEVSVGEADWMTRDQDNLAEERVGALPILEPSKWARLPSDAKPQWESELDLGFGTKVRILVLCWHGKERVLLGTSPCWEERLVAAQGDWSGWLSVADPSGERRGHVRFKVMAVAATGRRLRLYQSQVHADAGWTHPAKLATELEGVAGPFVEWTESYDRLQGWIDDQTQLEIYRQHVDWLGTACRHLLGTRDWDLFLTQLHILDMAYHVYWGAVDPTHPAFDPVAAPSYWDVLGQAHTLADKLVDTVVNAVDDDTLILVLGDHGHDSYHTTLLVNHVLFREGLLNLRRDRRTGALRIDWPETAAYASSYRIYLNLKGREPQGTIAPADRDTLTDRIIAALYGVVDERTGQRPVRFAVPRQDALGMGLYGPTMGDIVFATAPGYQSRTTFHLPDSVVRGHVIRRREAPLLRRTRLFRDFTGEHDTSLPWTQAIRTGLFAVGPGIAPRRPEVPVRIVDVAATISDFLGIDPPTGNEGNSMLPFLRASG